MNITKVANCFAKYSVERWNRCRIVRRVCRGCYRMLMEWPASLHNFYDGEAYRTCHPDADTYPYRDQRFAPWPECDEPGKYSLVTDCQDLVIRRSPSYVAWKYFEATGKRLKLLPGGNHVNDAKNWHEVLALNGFERVDSNQILDHIQKHWYYYIGVQSDYGEFGQVYWFESLKVDPDNPHGGKISVTTYEDFAFQRKTVDSSQITWYYLEWPPREE